MGGIEKMLVAGSVIWAVRFWGRRIWAFLKRHAFILALLLCVSSVAVAQDTEPLPVSVTDSERFDALISALGFLCGVQFGRFAFQIIRPV